MAQPVVGALARHPALRQGRDEGLAVLSNPCQVAATGAAQEMASCSTKSWTPTNGRRETERRHHLDLTLPLLPPPLLRLAHPLAPPA